MRYIENADLREWVKDNLRKAIFQKAHSLAVQTGCEILVKLEDTTDAKNSQYYATNTLQLAFKQSGVREKPGDLAVSGETGLPVTPTVDIAIQSCADTPEVDTIALDETSTCHSATENDTNCKASPDNTKTDGSIIPLHLTVTSGADNGPSEFQSVQQSFGMESSQSTSAGEQNDADVVLDFSLKNHQGKTKSTTTETHLSETLSTTSTATDMSTNSVGVEVEQSQIVALLQRPGLLQIESESRFTCQMCGRGFPKQQLLRDHMSRSHMQPSMPIVIQSQASQSSIAPVPLGGLDHVPDQSAPFGAVDTSVGVLSYPATLPTFSSAVQTALTDGTIQQVWDQFIRETTDFYFPDMPQEDGKARLAYQHIGRTMYEKYPSILSEGQTPWSHFNKALSSKIRWRRQKRKYLTDPGGGGGRPAKRPNSTPSPSSSNPMDEDHPPPALSSHSEEDFDVKPDVNELNRRILLAQQQMPLQLQVHVPAEGVVHLPSEAVVHLPPSEPSTSAMSPPMIDLGIPAKGLKKNILMQTGFYLTPELAAMGFSSTLQMTPEKVKPLLKQMSKEGYGIWVEDPNNKDKCGFIKWYPLNEKQQDEVNLTNEQYKRACVAKPQKPRALSREMEQFFDAYGGRKVRQNMSLL